MLLYEVIEQVKRKWLKRVKMEKKNLFTLEPKDMDIIIQELQGPPSERGTSVDRQNQN
jgi:hypothetical protein